MCQNRHICHITVDAGATLGEDKLSVSSVVPQKTISYFSFSAGKLEGAKRPSAIFGEVWAQGWIDFFPCKVLQHNAGQPEDGKLLLLGVSVGVRSFWHQ